MGAITAEQALQTAQEAIQRLKGELEEVKHRLAEIEKHGVGQRNKHIVTVFGESDEQELVALSQVVEPFERDAQRIAREMSEEDGEDETEGEYYSRLRAERP